MIRWLRRLLGIESLEMQLSLLKEKVMQLSLAQKREELQNKKPLFGEDHLD